MNRELVLLEPPMNDFYERRMASYKYPEGRFPLPELMPQASMNNLLAGIQRVNLDIEDISKKQLYALEIISQLKKKTVEEFFANAEDFSTDPQSNFAKQNNGSDAYTAVVASFRMFDRMCRLNVLTEQSFEGFHSLGMYIKARPSNGKKCPLLSAYTETLLHNLDNMIFEFPYIFSKDMIVDIMLAMPVLFWGGNTSTSVESDPAVSDQVKFLCDFIDGERDHNNFFTQYVQIFNRRDRGWMSLPSYEPLPLDVSALSARLKKKNLFDFEVVATPYHEVASKEWTDPKFAKSIDPVVLYFKKSVPSHFLMARRYSASGIFPAYFEMVSKTMDFMKKNMGKLRRFTESVSRPYWYRPLNERKELSTLSPDTVGNLVFTAEQVLKAYEIGCVKEFMLGTL